MRVDKEEEVTQESRFVDCKICGDIIEVGDGAPELVAFGCEEKLRADCPSCGATNYYFEAELYRLSA
jgi:rubrerythrin